MKLPVKYWVPIAGLTTFIATELVLRVAFGLGNPALLLADPNTGYRFQPNQKIFRFGKTIEYNQYSQRSEPITLQKPQGTLRILMTGDSVLNGGNPTNQDRTITELFEADLLQTKHPAEVLNASAGSWGIGNQLGYLREFGTFNSDAVILQIGTHDLLQSTSTSDAVGKSPAFPAHPPVLALQEAWSRYAWPMVAGILRLPSPVSDIPRPETTNLDQQFKQNMERLNNIVTLLRAKHVPVFVLYTPNREDLVPSFQIPPYKQEFFAHLKALQVPVIDTHAAWSNLPTSTVETYFRDIVHLSEAGNQAVADLLFEQLCFENQLSVCKP